MIIAQIENQEVNSVLIILTIVFIVVVFLYYSYKYIEQTYAEIKKKPFYINSHLFLTDVSKSQKSILEGQFSFYQKLNRKQKLIFRHRLKRFIKSKTFHGRQSFEVTDEMIVLISATAIMLTFGFRHYLLPKFHSILIYPEAFFSEQNKQLHKGEVNPRLGIIAFSWADFKKGYDIENDNLNLGIHEIGHAIHLSSFKSSDISSQIFMDGFKELKSYLKSNESKRQQLIATKYFRTYAYTNEFEFFAVLLECFIETPEEFKSKFPVLYDSIKTMLNFNFASF
ncbi:zinc-dependent peptidase [Winogradskyella litorisediminis]|uniref:Zinc-dependent peptidase n=1 Tax=Winogradskyella litorisediminis TaxID=1156618 RepID=A0ABW3N6P2_9FLAO